MGPDSHRARARTRRRIAGPLHRCDGKQRSDVRRVRWPPLVGRSASGRRPAGPARELHEGPSSRFVPGAIANRKGCSRSTGGRRAHRHRRDPRADRSRTTALPPGRGLRQRSGLTLPQPAAVLARTPGVLPVRPERREPRRVRRPADRRPVLVSYVFVNLDDARIERVEPVLAGPRDPIPFAGLDVEVGRLVARAIEGPERASSIMDGAARLRECDAPMRAAPASPSPLYSTYMISAFTLGRLYAGRKRMGALRVGPVGATPPRTSPSADGSSSPAARPGR